MGKQEKATTHYNVSRFFKNSLHHLPQISFCFLQNKHNVDFNMSRILWVGKEITFSLTVLPE